MTIVAAPPTRRRVFDGWIVVGAVSLMLLVAGGLGFYGLSVYLKALKDARGFSVGWISGATSMFFVVGGVVGILIARFIACRDVRIVIVFGAIVGGLSLALLGQVRELWQLYLVDAALAVGYACCFLVPATTVVTRWFHRRRSVALSISSTGISLGGLVFTPVASGLIDHLGLGMALPWLGVVWVVLVLTAAAFIWPDPTSRGERPDGDEIGAVVADGGGLTAAHGGLPYDEAIHSRFFKSLVLAYIFGMTAQVGALIHLFNRVSDEIDKSTAEVAVLSVALASVIFRLIGGVVALHVPLVRLTAAVFGVQVVALVILAAGSSTPALLAGSVLFGATIGNTLMLQPLLVAEAFGVRDYARLYSVNSLLSTVGVAAGPFVVGVLHDAAGGYGLAYLVAASLSVAAMAVMISAGPVTQYRARFAG